MIMLREREADDKTKIDHPTAYVAEVYEHWQEIDRWHKSFLHGTHQRHMWEVQAEAALDLYRDAKECAADDIDDVMAFREARESREKTYPAWAIRCRAVTTIQGYRWRAAGGLGPGPGYDMSGAQLRAAEQAVFDFAKSIVGKAADGILEEVERAV